MDENSKGNTHLLRGVVLVLMALWLCLAGILGVNMFRQYKVGRLQVKVLHDYQLISQINPFFKAAVDSIHREIRNLDNQTRDLQQTFPFKDSGRNWLFIRLAVITLTLISVFTFWFFYKKHIP